ncbi:hypothetical protein GW17_00002695 [Ensete ventricosum]|nr:hypothetical protein GW17_00002695 [Ensete ventricosum]RZS15370.1 hypothetical protein BHM03_00047198 [Ensete ventricosum]
MNLVILLSQRQSDGARIFGSAARYASTNIAQRSSGGFFSWLTGGSSGQLPPLDFPLPGVSLPPPLPDIVEPGNTKITTLPNGLKIASETSPIGYTYDALKTYMPEMVEVLIDSVRNAVFLDWEVNEQLKKVGAELGELSHNPQGLLLEAIHSAAYSGALANPLIAPDHLFNTFLQGPEFISKAVDLAARELLAVATPGQGFYNLFVLQMVVSEDIGRQILTYGER